MRILVFSESRIAARTLEEFLSDAGHEVSSFRRGEDFLMKVAGGLPTGSLVIADLEPCDEMTRETLMLLRKECPGVPVIAMTGRGPTVSTREALSCGIYGFIRKPIHLSELELMVIRICQGLGVDVGRSHELIMPSDAVFVQPPQRSGPRSGVMSG